MALTFNDDQEAELLKTIGLPEANPGETDVQLVLDTIADLAEQAGGVDSGKPSAIAAAAKAAGLEVVDTASLAALRSDAAEGRRMQAAAELAQIETTVDDAINKGKIPTARRAHWVALIQADAGMAEVLAATPNETAVALTELGHSLEPISTTGNGADDEWFY